jgi:hypothetical protein
MEEIRQLHIRLLATSTTATTSVTAMTALRHVSGPRVGYYSKGVTMRWAATCANQWLNEGRVRSLARIAYMIG